MKTEEVREAARVLPAPPRPELSARRRSTRRRLTIVFAILLFAVGFLLYKGLTSAVVYFKTANEAVADRASLGSSTFQIEGTVLAGSIREEGPKVVDFTIYSGKTHVAVDNSGDPPQLFQAGVPVVLVGHFVVGSNTFSSDEILIKHSNQYIAAHPNRVRATDGKTH